MPKNSPSLGRPALDRLEKHHDELLEEFRVGFPSINDLIFWSQRFAVQSLGMLPNDVYKKMHRDPSFWSLVTKENEQTARRARVEFESKYLLPATRSSFRFLQKSAGEYFDAEFDEAVIIGQEEFIAMRPALNYLSSRQEEVLNSYLNGGIGTEEEDLLDWLRSLTWASYGEINQDIQIRSFNEKPTRKMLMGTAEMNAEVAKFARQKFAFEYLLPAFNAGARKLTGKAGEDITDGDQGSSKDDHLNA